MQLSDEERKKIYEEEKAKEEMIQKVDKKKKNQPILIGCFAVIGIIIIVFAVVMFIMSSPSSKTTKAAPKTEIIKNEPKLELLTWKWGHTESESYIEVNGEVKNISGESLSNVQAIASFYTKDDIFIKSSEALIEYNPILPGQTSPFKLIETANPAMHSAKIEFKYLFGGVINTKHNPQKK